MNKIVSNTEYNTGKFQKYTYIFWDNAIARNKNAYILVANNSRTNHFVQQT